MAPFHSREVGSGYQLMYELGWSGDKHLPTKRKKEVPLADSARAATKLHFPFNTEKRAGYAAEMSRAVGQEQ